MADLFLISTGAENFVIDKTYADVALSIEVMPINLRLNWYKAGYLKILLPFEGQWLPISTKPILLTWRQIVEIPYQEYRLLFTPENWLESPNFIVKPYAIKYNPMSIGYPSSVPSTASAGTATTIPAATVSTTIAAFNASRTLGGLIVNKSNKRLWIRFDALTATTAFPSIDIPANGGSIDIPDGYIGQITGIWEAAATGAVTLIEYIAV